MIPGNKTEWYTDEIVFLKSNFYTMTNRQLCNYINSHRVNGFKIGFHSMRDKCYKMGLKRCEVYRWNKDDIKKLKVWYPLMGNTELAEYLNKYGTSGRRYNEKNIQKKMKLLKLRRSPEQLKRIMVLGDYYELTEK